MHAAPAWVTATVWPAIVSTAPRGEDEELAAADTVTFAVPVLPAVTVSQAALSTALHEQPVAAVTVSEAVLAVDASDNAVVESVYVHGAPACVTVTVWPATVTLPVRGAVPAFAVTENLAEPAPVALLPAVIVIQGALLIDVHPQPVLVLTVTLPDPAPDASDTLVVDSG